MKELQLTVMTGTFVIFEGISPPTEDTSGYWQTWPTEVESRDTDCALSIMPLETFRFRFFDLQLFLDDAEAHLKNGKLDRFVSGNEIRNTSGFFYPNCIPITPQQAFELPRTYCSSKVGREMLVPIAHLSLPHDANFLAYQPNYQIVIGSDRRGHLLRPGDSILSTREWDKTEFRKLYLNP